MRLMTGPADEELHDVVQRERKDYRDDLIAADTAEVEDQAERISRALRSAKAPRSAGQPRRDEPTGSGA